MTTRTGQITRWIVSAGLFCLLATSCAQFGSRGSETRFLMAKDGPKVAISYYSGPAAILSDAEYSVSTSDDSLTTGTEKPQLSAEARVTGGTGFWELAVGSVVGWFVKSAN